MLLCGIKNLWSSLILIHDWRKLCFAFDLLFIYLYVAATVPCMFLRGLDVTSDENRQLIYFIWTGLAFGILFSSRFIVLAYSGYAETHKDWVIRHSIWHVYIMNLGVLAHGGASKVHSTKVVCNDVHPTVFWLLWHLLRSGHTHSRNMSCGINRGSMVQLSG